MVEPATVSLDHAVSLGDAARLAEGDARLALSPFARSRMAAAHQRLTRCVDERRIVYGVTTGFGPLADRLVNAADIETLQRNLIYHLASGVGAPLPWRAARAVAVARLSSLTQGWSGASEALIGGLTALINSDLAPLIPEKGTVGASGDLTPLAHLALALMGEGAFIDPQGDMVSAEAGLARLGVAPLTLAARDGLALVNGVSAMTGIAALNAVDAERMIAWCTALTALTAELLCGRSEAWSAEFAQARPHPGQARAAADLRERVRDSGRIIAARAAEGRLPKTVKAQRPERADRPLQDPYSTRCAPQILGAVRDAAAFHTQTVERELNAASDNPLFGSEPPFALHGGNFMGQHVAFASDALSNAVIMTAILSERQIARLTDERVNGDLPAFLSGEATGLHSGFMGAQVTATALVAELRAKGSPASIQSISTNADNQDVVSMGTIAARKARDALADAWRVLAIHALAAAQGADLLARAQQSDDAEGAPRAVSPAGWAVRGWVRARAEFLAQDRPLAADIERVAADLAREDPPASHDVGVHTARPKRRRAVAAAGRAASA